MSPRDFFRFGVLTALVATLCGPSGANSATDGPAVTAPGVITAVVGPKQLAYQTGLTSTLLQAFIKMPNKSSKVYDLWNLEQLDREVLRNFQSTPPNRSTSNPALQDPQDSAVLKNAFKACIADEESDGDCFRQFGSTDYENVLGDPDGFALSKETQLFRPKLDGRTRDVLSAQMTQVLTLIQAQIQTERAPGAAPLQPVQVVIGETGDLNIQSRFGGQTIVFGEAAIRTIFQQSFHRAIYATRLVSAEAGLLEDCEACNRSGIDQPSYLNTPERYIHFMSNFPNLRFRTISNRWWANAVRNGCRAQLPPDADAAMDEISSSDQDLRSLIPQNLIERLSACANDGKVGISKKDLKPYLDEIRLSMESDYDQEYMFDLVRVTTEGSIFYSILSAELAKSFAFLLGHESYHLWISPNAGPQAELDADAHAVQVFLRLFPQINLNTWYKVADKPGIGMLAEDSEGGADRFSLLGSSLMGRDPTVLLRELYRGARFTQDGLHPPVEQRVNAVSVAIADQRIKFTCDEIAAYQQQAREYGFGSDAEGGFVCPTSAHNDR